MLVSVIIPTYNRAESVVEAIQSVQRQTYTETQIIVVDDGSEDDTRARIEKLGGGIEYYYQANQRQGAARNTGLNYARGEYIATLDSDDVWNDDFLSESVECLEKHRLDFVFSNWMTKTAADGDGGGGGCFPSDWETMKAWTRYVKNPSGSWFLLDSAEVRKLFVQMCPAPSSSLLLRRESMASGWNANLKIADDWCLVLDMVLAKNCRAAFTLRRMFTKSINANNVYEGRSRRNIAAELEIHDMRLMKRRFAAQLTAGEKMIFDRRIIKGNLISAAYFLKNRLGIKRDLKFW